MTRQRREDALKAILTAALENRPLSAPGLAGMLGVSYATTIRLIEEMGASGLVCWGPAGLEVTPAGRISAIRLLRAHRLTERFLVDEARMALERVHRVADRAEHGLSDSELAELNEQLGHPDWDPHGDPIPDARGHVAQVERFPLDSWPLHRRAVITHVEDEPPYALRRLLAKGLHPGAELKIVSRGEDNLTLDIASREIELPVSLARQVHVRACSALMADPVGARLYLADLPSGDRARILGLDTSCRGFTRRRLLDLGITPGAFVEVEMTNAGGSARVYKIRDTLIALRREQAGQVIIQSESSEKAGAASA
jgi:DtxR family Mn-dependent transcriptional regulator